MKSFIHEYGLVIVAVITCSMFLGFVVKLNSHDKGSLSFTYKTHMLYTDFYDKVNSGTISVGDLLDSLNGVSNVVDTVNKPYFELDKSLKLDNTFRLNEIDSDYFSKSESDKDKHYYMSANGYNKLKERLTIDINGNTVIKVHDSKGNIIDLDDLHIIIIEYRPKVEYRQEDLDYTKFYKLDSEYALDEFGHRIEDGNGDFIKSQQLQYSEIVWKEPDSSGSLNDASNSIREYKNINEFKIDPDLPSRYKIIYRYQDGRLKCEYTSLFINEIRSESDILNLYGDGYNK